MKYINMVRKTQSVSVEMQELVMTSLLASSLSSKVLPNCLIIKGRKI